MAVAPGPPGIKFIIPAYYIEILERCPPHM